MVLSKVLNQVLPGGYLPGQDRGYPSPTWPGLRVPPCRPGERVLAGGTRLAVTLGLSCLVVAKNHEKIAFYCHPRGILCK